MSNLTKGEMLELLRARVAFSGSQQKAAKQLGISPQYLGDILKNRRDVSDSVADAMGYERESSFKPKDRKKKATT